MQLPSQKMNIIICCAEFDKIVVGFGSNITEVRKIREVQSDIIILSIIFQNIEEVYLFQ